MCETDDSLIIYLFNMVYGSNWLLFLECKPVGGTACCSQTDNTDTVEEEQLLFLRVLIFI